MAKYIVEVREVWVRSILVEADSPYEATDTVYFEDGEQEEINFEFSHFLDSSDWNTYLMEEQDAATR
jgi:hypothetical protein